MTERAVAAPDDGDVGGILYVVGSALAFGAMAVLARIAYRDGVDVPTLLALRFTLAAITMALFGWHSLVEHRLVVREAWLTLIALGAIGYAGQALAYFTALMHAPAGLVALLLYVHPALVAMLAVWLLHERLTPEKLFALGLALGGSILTIVPSLARTAGAIGAQPIGIALALAAAAIYACYIVVSTPLARRLPAIPMSTVVIASAAVVFVITVAVRGAHWPMTGAGWLAVVGIALISTVAAITMYFAGLARIGATRAATLSTVEPAFTVLLASMVLGERMRMSQVLGGALILAAVIILSRPQRRPRPKQAAPRTRTRQS